MKTRTQTYDVSDHVSLKMESDWDRGELLDTKVTIIRNTLPIAGSRTFLTTIAGSDIPQFVRTFKLMLKTFSI